MRKIKKQVIGINKELLYFEKQETINASKSKKIKILHFIM